MKRKILAVLLLLGLFAGVLTGCTGEIPPAPTGNVGGEDVEFYITDSKENIPDGVIAVYQITEIRVLAMQDTAEVYLKNPAANAGEYYLMFELRLPNGDDYKTLYTSNFVSPGTETPRLDLSEKLPAGTYDAVLVVTAYRMYDVTPVDNVELPIKLIAK